MSGRVSAASLVVKNTDDQNVGLDLAIAFAWAQWNEACQKALQETITMGEPSEKTMIRVETLEKNYNCLIETKRDQYGDSSSSSTRTSLRSFFARRIRKSESF